MAVWTTARARATTVGPALVARTVAKVCSPQDRTTSSLDEGPYPLKWNVASGPLALAGLNGSGSPAKAEEIGLKATTKTMIGLISRPMRALLVLAMWRPSERPAPGSCLAQA